MREHTTFSVGVAIVLNEVSRMLLYKKVKNGDGQEVLIDREIPFRLKYRLNKNRMMLESDVKKFNQTRMIALAKYGEQSPDGESIIITDPEKKQKFQDEVSALIDSQVTHPLNLLDPADFELINDSDILVSPEAMSIFTAYLVDDPDFQKDIDLSVNFRNYEAPKTEENTKTEEVKVEEPVVEEVKPEPVVEEVKVEAPIKKTTRKPSTKKTTAKKAEEPKVEEAKVEEVKPEVKKTTTKKSTTTKKTDTATTKKAETTAKKTTTTTKKTTTKKTTKKDETNG